MHFDTVMSWLVFAIYVLFIFLLTSFLCQCSKFCSQTAESTDSSLQNYGFDSLQASAELAGYLRTPLPYKDWRELEEAIDNLPSHDKYKEWVHAGIGLQTEYLPDFVNGYVEENNVKKFLKKHPELYTSPSGKGFLTYGDFITRLSSYEDHPSSVFAFRILTRVLFTTEEGRETCLPVEIQRSGRHGSTTEVVPISDGSYTLPFISLYFEGQNKLDEVDSPGHDRLYANRFAPKYRRSTRHSGYGPDLRFNSHHQSYSGCSYFNPRKSCWSTGTFILDRSKITVGCAPEQYVLVNEGYKIIPGSDGSRIGVTLLTHSQYREVLSLVDDEDTQ